MMALIYSSDIMVMKSRRMRNA